MFKAKQLDSGLYTQEELNEKHLEIIQTFLERIDGKNLRGMLLTSIEYTPTATSVEVVGGSSAEDSIRAALCILEGVMVRDKDGDLRIIDPDKREILTKVIEVLSKINEEDNPSIIILSENEDGTYQDITRGPGLEDDDDNGNTRH